MTSRIKMRRLRPLGYAEIARRIAALEHDGGATIVATEDERGARSAIDARRESPMTDREWRVARSNLLAFVGILSEWSAQTDGQ
jgi:hypothetical protein